MRDPAPTPVHTAVAFPTDDLRCGKCGRHTRHWHDDQQCGTVHDPCPAGWWLLPCGHNADAVHGHR